MTQHTKLIRRLACGAAVTVAAAAALPAAASADSIAYVKDGDVWLASPDGARKQQVTRTGGYAYVSQADDGTMIALAPKERLHRLSRTGKVLAQADPNARRGYELRASHSEPGLEEAEAPRQLTP